MKKVINEILERVILLGITIIIAMSPLTIMSATFNELASKNIAYINPGSLVYDPNNNYIYLVTCFFGLIQINPKNLQIVNCKFLCICHLNSIVNYVQISVFDPCNGYIYIENYVLNPVCLTHVKTFNLTQHFSYYTPWFYDVFDPRTHDIYIVYDGYLNVINAKNNTLVKTIQFPCFGVLQSAVLSNGAVLFMGMNCNLEMCYLILFNPWNYSLHCKRIQGMLGFLYYDNCEVYIALSNNSILVINEENLQTINIYNCYNIEKYGIKYLEYIGYCKIINAAIDNGYMFYTINHTIIPFGNVSYGIYDPNTYAFYMAKSNYIIVYSACSKAYVIVSCLHSLAYEKFIRNAICEAREVIAIALSITLTVLFLSILLFFPYPGGSKKMLKIFIIMGIIAIALGITLAVLSSF